MKKIFTILTVVALTTTVSFAQTEYGATLGLNMASISGDDFVDNDMRLGLRLGLSFSRELSDIVTLNSGLVYSVKGASYEAVKFNIDASGNLLSLEDVDADYSLNYLEIPVNFGFAVSDQFSLMAGFYSAFLVGVSNTVDGEDMDADTDGWATIDFGIGLGAEFSVNDAISIKAGYQMGLSALDENGDADAKNSNILIGMTYSFGGRY
jgi:opacity protein-like surface antigen